MGQVLAVLGGSGLYEVPGLSGLERLEINTPYGPPSDSVVRAQLGGTTLLFLPRHGNGHTLLPSEINYRANICALKLLGATHVLSISAVGSMREDLAPGDVVVIDQFIDLTKGRASTFFGDGVAAHVSLADPICPLLAASTADAAEIVGAPVHRGGTYLCMEGPQFSTRAESHLYRSWGVAVIGMTNMPEAKLAREAELPYATLALVTDYDCWHEQEADVTVDAVLAVLRRNVETSRKILRELAMRLPPPEQSPAFGALAHAVLTPPSAISEGTATRLQWLLPHLRRDQS